MGIWRAGEIGDCGSAVVTLMGATERKRRKKIGNWYSDKMVLKGCVRKAKLRAEEQEEDDT